MVLCVVHQLITEKAKFLNLVITNESKRLILNATNTPALRAHNIAESCMNTVTTEAQIRLYRLKFKELILIMSVIILKY
jgi:hypothetical protein